MTHITRGLTAKNRDQLRNPTLGNRIWATFLQASRFESMQLHGTLHDKDEQSLYGDRPLYRRRITWIRRRNFGFQFGAGLAYFVSKRNKHKFGKFILRKIIKTAANRCHILKLKCTKFDFGWASPGPLCRFKGAYFQGKEREEGRHGGAREETSQERGLTYMARGDERRGGEGGKRRGGLVPKPKNQTSPMPCTTI